MRRRHRASVPLPCRLSAAPRAHRRSIAALCGASTAAAATGRIAGRSAAGAGVVARRHRRRSRGRRPGRASRSRSSTAASIRRSPEFAGRPNTTFLNDQTVDGPGEYHGTAVASLAVAACERRRHRRRLSAGGVPELRREPGPAQITDMTAAQGIVAAAQHCPGVISISFGGTNQDPQLEDAVLYALHNGCLIVAAAGNGGLEGNPPEYPAAYPHVLTRRRHRPERRGRTPSRRSRRRLDVSAPGVGMMGAVPLTRDPSGYLPASAGRASQRRSSARPQHGSGRCDRPSTQAQIFQLVLQSAHDVGAPGFDSASGFGMVNIPAALAAAPPAVDPQEPNDDIDQIKPGGALRRRPAAADDDGQAFRSASPGASTRRGPARPVPHLGSGAPRRACARRGRRRGRTHLGAADGRRRARASSRGGAICKGPLHPRRERWAPSPTSRCCSPGSADARATCSSVTASKR